MYSRIDARRDYSVLNSFVRLSRRGTMNPTVPTSSSVRHPATAICRKPVQDRHLRPRVCERTTEEYAHFTKLKNERSWLENCTGTAVRPHPHHVPTTLSPFAPHPDRPCPHPHPHPCRPVPIPTPSPHDFSPSPSHPAQFVLSPHHPRKQMLNKI